MPSPVKERLTGALILIVAVVVIVPELFSGRAQNQPATATPDAQSADAGPPLRSYTMDLGGAKGGARGGGERGDAQNQVQGQAQAPVAPAAAPATIEDVAKVGTEKPPSTPIPATPPPSTSTQATTAPAMQPPATKPPATLPPTASSRGWWVQLGSFSSRANADRLGETLSKAGYAVQISPTTTNGKELFRVRAGPVGDREAAVALQARLGASGHKGSLVAPR